VRELPGDIFVTGQILPTQMKSLAAQGIKSFINNRPDMEAPMQPLSEELERLAQELGVDYVHVPMAAGLTPDIIDASVTAYRNLPEPIVAFCASGTRSAALWCFAHAEEIGVENVLEAVSRIGYPLQQIRALLESYLKSP